MNMVMMTVNATQLQYGAYRNVTRWLAPSRGIAPHLVDEVLASKGEFKLVIPPWLNTEAIAPLLQELAPNGVFTRKQISEGGSNAKFNQLLSTVNSAPIFVPVEKAAEVEAFLKDLSNRDQSSAFLRLRSYMMAVGIVESFPFLSLVHATDVPPATILQEGLLSAQALKAQDKPHTRWGQRLGDGIYTVGAQGWSNDGGSSWGKFQYNIRYENAAVMRGNNMFGGAFVSIYEQLLIKYNRADDRFQFDGIMAPSLPDSPFGSDRIGRMPTFFTDLGLLGISSPLEIFVKRQHIQPHRIFELKPR
jgi:hypothetical protein